jgi:hypothetical protein
MAMRHAIRCVVVSTAALLVFAGRIAAQSPATPGDAKTAEGKIEQKADDKKAEPSLVGSWRANSLSMTLADGSRKTLAGQREPVSLIIAEKTCTLRVGDTVLASMSYVLDAKHDPWTIDMKTADGVLLGICAQKGDSLELSLDDEARGRPRDFNKQTHGMALALRRFHGGSLLVIDADGGNPHPILTMPEFTFVGSPDWSHNGKIAFDTWRSVLGESLTDARVFVVDAGGGEPQDLGAGAMPSWSPDDKQLTFCQYDPRGVWIMNADGSDRRMIDPGGWASQWSPKRNEIAYVVNENGGAALHVYDVARNEHRAVPHKPYSGIYWGLAWSPDGTWICFKGILPGGGSEIAAVSVEGEKKGFKVLLPSSAPEIGNANSTTAWGGTGSQILVSMQRKADPARQLYVFDSSGARPPQLFPKFPAEWSSGDMAWSPDGKKVVLTAFPAEKHARAAAVKPAVEPSKD